MAPQTVSVGQCRATGEDGWDEEATFNGGRPFLPTLSFRATFPRRHTTCSLSLHADGGCRRNEYRPDPQSLPRSGTCHVESTIEVVL